MSGTDTAARGNPIRSTSRLSGPKREGASLHVTHVKVKITLSQSVAWPGHALSITAVASPSGGTFAWTVKGGGAALVDNAGKPTKSGPMLSLRSFLPDDILGSIPATSADVSVTYTLPKGKAMDTIAVPIHGIVFDVPAPMEVTPGLTYTFEDAGEDGRSVGAEGKKNAPPAISTDPKVMIILDESCLRKTECARNHQVGFLQTIIADDRRARYTVTEAVKSIAVLPVRDALTDASIPTPFYSSPKPFRGDGDEQAVHHEDRPGVEFSWDDPRTGAAKDLKQICFMDKFNVWLAVQNIDWAAHDRKHSFVYLRNFSWWLQLKVTADFTQVRGSRVSPDSSPAQVGVVGVGKGKALPNLEDAIANMADTKAAKTSKVKKDHVTICKPLPPD